MYSCSKIRCSLKKNTSGDFHFCKNTSRLVHFFINQWPVNFVLPKFIHTHINVHVYTFIYVDFVLCHQCTVV